MDEMPSAEFRRTYARLMKPTMVTVNGHVIGQWSPIGRTEDVKLYPDGEVRVDRPREWVEEPRFNSRGSRPVPK